MNRILRQKLCRKLRSHSGAYKQVIEVRVPVRFYWAEDGFDGVEFGPLRGLNKYQHSLIRAIVNEFMELMKAQSVTEADCKAVTKVPDIFKKAFGE